MPCSCKKACSKKHSCQKSIEVSESGLPKEATSQNVLKCTDCGAYFAKKYKICPSCLK